MSSDVPDGKSQDVGTGTQVFVLLTFSGFAPMMVYANAGESPVVFTLVVSFLGIAFLGFLARWALVALGLCGLGATYSVSVFLLVLTNAGIWMGKLDSGRLIFLALALVLAALVYRFRDLKVVRFGISWVALFLLGYPIAVVLGDATSTTVHLNEPETIDVRDFETKPDVILLVVDGYGSPIVLDEMYGFDSEPFQSELENAGFQVNDFTLANYSMTQLSVPSVLDMDYLAEDTALSDADVDILLDKLGGANAIFDEVSDQGYQTVYVESGWLGTRCGEGVDVCVRAPWPDETFADVMSRSLLSGLPGFEVGRSFTRGALHALEWLDTEVETYLTNGVPDLIYVHLLLPHPPLFLDSSCESNFQDGTSGFVLGGPGSSDQEMSEIRSQYLEQVECVNASVLELIDRIGPDTALFVVGDHGPDSLHQLFVSAEPWTEEQSRERLSTFFAGRIADCDLSDVASIVNIGRVMLGCLSEDEIPILDDRTFAIRPGDSGTRVVEQEPPRP